MTDVRLKISPPWITFVNKLQALFDGDPLIAFNLDYQAKEGPTVTMACGDGDKTAALLKIVPAVVEFGNVTLNINIDGVPSNRVFTSAKELYEVAFHNNPAFAYCVAPAQEGYYFVDFTYVVFKNCVVQFFNDNLNDAHGLLSTLYQDIAEDVLLNTDYHGVYYCTDVERGMLGKPLGEWP